MRSASQAREMEASTLVTKARTAFHSAAAKAERVLIDFKSEFIADREDNGKRFSDLSENSDDEFADNRTDSRLCHELKNSRWSVDSRTEKSWQERFRNFRGKKRVEDIEKPVDATMASQVFDGNVCHTCVKDVSEPKASESPSEDFSRFNYLDTVPLAPTMRQLAIAVEAGKELKSVKDLILSGNTSPLREKAGLSLTVMKSLVLREKEETSGKEYNNDKKLCTMIESLLHEEEKRKKTPMTSEELNDTISLTRDIHAAPSKSFVVKLAEAIGSFKTLRKMAIFWCEIVNELRKLWSEGQHLPSIPLDEVPDLNYCLLYQQLQVINCCVSRKKRRAITLESLNSVKDGTTNIEELYICRGEVPSVPLLYARNNTGELVLRLGVDSPCEQLKMLETGEPIYSPVTQEMPLLTEDVVKETEELVLRTGSVGVGCSQLLSDMQAFKAANPGCILEDFVRWHSPPDWTESEDCDMVEGTSQSGEIVSSRGRLSTRMQKQDENAIVEVVFPNAAAAAEADAQLTGGYAASDEPNSAAVPSSGSGNVTPNEKDFESIVASTLGKMPPELAAMAKDPKRHAKSKDPGWKYGFWPYEGKRDMVQCIFCRKVVPAGIKRFKQHIAGGYGDVEKCPTAPAIVRKEMYDFLKKNARKGLNLQQGREWDCEADSGGEVQETCAVPSSGTRIKESNRMFARSYLDSAKQGSQKFMKSVSSMLQKSPEDVVSERHSSRNSQTSTMEHCTKKSKEVKQRVDDHVADFFYENGIPLNAINSRSWEIMLESIGQYGPGYRSPSYHDIRNPLLDRALERVNETKKKHEEAWKEYGCSIMSDGWTDTRHHHLINFLANSPAGTFFLGSVDASNEVADAIMLADLLEKQIEKVGKEYVVQVVTDNGANFKAAGRILMERIPTLFWTPCAAHCLDLLLEDIGKIKEFHKCINNAKKVCRFIYKHGRLLAQMRNKLGGDLVRPAVTRFATSFFTLASMYKHKADLRSLFVSTEWHDNKLAASEEGRTAEKIILSIQFWNTLEICLKASQPLLIALRIADGDETPAAPEIKAAMDTAKQTIRDSLADKPQLLNEVLTHFDRRWEKQMEQKLYGAALFLNPAKFFAIKEKSVRDAARLRAMFNDVLWKMVPNDDEQCIISKQADDYEKSQGEAFSRPLAIKDRARKNPVNWWGAYGGLAYELMSLAKKIVSLCCSASGCERNWSTFSQIHTKRRNRLEHKRLNNLVFVSYNRKMANRFAKLRELGSKGKKYNPLHLDEFQWENEWVDAGCEPVHQDAASDTGNDLTWQNVDEATGATQGLGGRNLPRAAAMKRKSGSKHAAAAASKRTKQPRTAAIPVEDEVSSEEDDEMGDESGSDYEDDEEGGGGSAAGAFQVDDAVL